MANFLFVLSKDDHQAATRCFQFAQIAHSKGHQVDIFFIEDGVLWADSTRDLTEKTTTGDCPKLVVDEWKESVCGGFVTADQIRQEPRRVLLGVGHCAPVGADSNADRRG